MSTLFIFLTLAAVLHGLTGMGFPLISTPALASAMPLPIAIAMLALPTLLINALVLFGKNTPDTNFIKDTQNTLKRYWLLALSSVIGSIIGVKLLFLLPVSLISLVMAVVIFYYATQGILASMVLVSPLRVPTGTLSMASFGLASGLIGGATNAMSPILLMYLFSKTHDKNDIAKASNLCYLLAKLVQIYMLHAQFASFDASQWQLLLWIALISCLGLAIGLWLRRYISQVFFKNLIYVVLLILSLKIGYGALL